MNGIKKQMIGTAILAVGIVMSVAKVQGAVFLSDGFDDGNFTSNPPWSVYDGTGWTVTNDLGRTVLMDDVGALGTEAGTLYTDLRSPANTGSPTTFLRSAGALQLDVTTRVLANAGYYYSLALTDSGTGYLYNMFVYTGASLGAIILQKYDGANHNLAEVDFSSPWPTDQYIDLSLVVDPSGTISALTNGVLVVSASDSALTSFNQVKLISYNDIVAFDSVQVFEPVPEPSVALLGLAGGLVCVWGRRTRRTNRNVSNQEQQHKGERMNGIKKAMVGTVIMASFMLGWTEAPAAVFTLGGGETVLFSDDFSASPNGWALSGSAISGGELYPTVSEGQATRVVDLDLNSPGIGYGGGAIYFRMRTANPTGGEASRVEIQWDNLSGSTRERITIKPGAPSTISGFPYDFTASSGSSSFDDVNDFDDFRFVILKRGSTGYLNLFAYEWDETNLEWDLIVSETNKLYSIGDGTLHLLSVYFRNASDPGDRSYLGELAVTQVSIVPEPATVVLVLCGGAIVWRRRGKMG